MSEGEIIEYSILCLFRNAKARTELQMIDHSSFSSKVLLSSSLVYISCCSVWFPYWYNKLALYSVEQKFPSVLWNTYCKVR